MKNLYKICFLGYQKLSEMTVPVINSLNFPDTEIAIRDCNIETLPEVVNKAVADNFDIFIAGSANAAEFSRYSHKHLVEIRLSTSDYLMAIKKALKIGKRPAIAIYNLSRDINLPLIEELSGVHPELIEYEDSSQLYDGIRQSDCDVIIGASHANQIAAMLDKKSVLLYFGENSIRSAILRARSLAIELHKEARTDRIISSIISQAPFGLIVSDEQGRIIIINDAARHQTGLDDARLHGRPLSDILPPLSPNKIQGGELRHLERRMLLNDAYIRCSQTRIDSKHGIIGVLTTLYTDNSRRQKKDRSPGDDFVARNHWDDLIQESSAMQSAIRSAKQFADSPHPLVIRGETGCGKEIFAECIHNCSLRASEPFIAINAASIPDQDAMRLLFGSEDSGAVRPGLLELAQGGTVLLQNISSASVVVQSCFTQVLKEHRFLRCCGTAYVSCRARFIVTLDASASKDTLSEGLMQQLSIFALDVPPLRDRKEDIVPLFSSLVSREIDRLRFAGNSSVKQLLEYYSWRGNGAELAAACKRYAFSLNHITRPTAAARLNLLIQAIGEDKLLNEIIRRHPSLADGEKADTDDFMDGIADMKKILRYSNSQIAEKLSLSRTTLWRMTREKESIRQ